jgi:hypothetical protein
MTILTVGSNNPKFSFIVSKNPETIKTSKEPFKRGVRKGFIYGWFSKLDNSEFRVLFKDSDLEASFADQGEFEYLDKTRYSSPYLPIQMIEKALKTASTGVPEDVPDDWTVGACKAYVETVIEVPMRVAGRFKVEAPFSIVFSPLCGNFQKVRIESDTVSSALGLLQILCVVATITAEDIYIPLGKDVIFKYLGIIKKADVPYNIRQLFISRAISNGKLLEMARQEGLIDTDRFKFQFGNTQLQRLLSIKKAFEENRKDVPKLLVDVGCGELSHAFKLAGLYDGIVGFDGDPEICRVNELKLKKRGVENISVFNKVVDEVFVKENSGTFEEADVLVSEVLEHMSYDQAEKLLRALLETDAERIVVTVPCGEFNKFYGMSESEMRHEDHVWEPSRETWKKLIEGVLPATRKVSLVDVGDVVDGIPCTMMAVFDRV